MLSALRQTDGKILMKMSNLIPDLPSEIISVITTFLDNLTDISAVLSTSTEWRLRGDTVHFWLTWIGTSQSRYDRAIVSAGGHGRSVAVCGLWRSASIGLVRNGYILVKSMVASLQNNQLDAARALYEICGRPSKLDDTWNNRERIIFSGALSRCAKKRDWEGFFDLWNNGHRTANAVDVDEYLAQYATYDDLVRIYGDPDMPRLLNDHDELLHNALENGNLALVKELDTRYDIHWDSQALSGISSSNPDVILYTIMRERKYEDLPDNFDDVTPQLLREFVGKDDVTIQYRPLRAMYITKYPDDAFRIIDGSWQCMDVEELVGYLNNLPLYVVSTDIGYLVHELDRWGYDYMLGEVNKWMVDKTDELRRLRSGNRITT